ncbi:DUF3329 domain-containing protein [Oryzibacter oryziterrae]|uniref:DUF3329 domain-containing protein n=1 Tax=Oryzibacter oryziterrae TaxID=2766474 RepID=UPI001F414CC5|nr:DUF3329 domain-containing protein [Oryzibacter oryziterrae]
MKIVDVDHPFYRPLWRRVVLVVALGVWTAIETFVFRDSTWMIITGALFVYAALLFLVRWPHGSEKADGTKD